MLQSGRKIAKIIHNAAKKFGWDVQLFADQAKKHSRYATLYCPHTAAFRI